MMSTVFLECPRRPGTTLYDLCSAAGDHEPTPELAARQRATIIEPMPGPLFICGAIDPEPVCACGHTAEMLCDFPMGRGKTCDLPVCWCCSRSIGDDRDLCLIHHAIFVRKAGVEKINPWPPRRAT